MLKSVLLFVMFVFTCCTISCTAAFGSGSREKNFRTEVQWISDGDLKKGAKSQYGPGDYGRKIKFNGKRFYEMHVPPLYNKATPMPVVLVFHGGGGDPGTIRYESDMDRTADREGFLVVYPAGTNKRLLLKDRLLLWNDGRPLKDGSYSTTDDVGFIAAMLDDLARMFNINTKMIYACGYSNGAQFTYRLAKRLSNRIAAIASVAGPRPANDPFDSPPSRPMSIMQFAGLEDKISPYHGGKPQTGDAEIKADAYPIKETIESWVSFDKCSSKPAETKKIGKAEMYRYGPCQDGSEIVLWKLEDGGHTWPGGRVVPNVELLGLGKMGNINHDIKASDLMWEFFKKHPLKK